MNLTDLFDLSFQGRRGKTALEFQGQMFTFGDLDMRSNRMAHALAARGVTADDRLCAYLPNSVEMVDLFLACVKLGAIFVPINILYKDREISHVLSDAGPRAVVTSSEAFPAVAPVWRPEVLAAEAIRHDSRRPAVTLDGDAPAALVYTSGTTGVSKGVILTHNNFASNALNLITCWQITEADRFLLALPLFHVHGLANGLHAWLISGCRTRLLERFEHRSAAEQFLDFRPTVFFGVPTIYVRLLDTPPEAARPLAASCGYLFPARPPYRPRC